MGDYYVPLGRLEDLLRQLAEWSQEGGNVPRVRVDVPAVSVGDPIDPNEPQPAMPPTVCAACGKSLP